MNKTPNKAQTTGVEVMGFQNSCNTAHTSNYVSKNFVIRSFPGLAFAQVCQLKILTRKNSIHTLRCQT